MNHPSFDYFDHQADMGIIGRGATIEQAFEQAARAVFAYMADLSKVSAREVIHIEFEEKDPELALVEWLNQLIGESRQAGLLLAQFSLHRRHHHWIGEAS